MYIVLDEVFNCVIFKLTKKQRQREHWIVYIITQIQEDAEVKLIRKRYHKLGPVLFQFQYE